MASYAATKRAVALVKWVVIDEGDAQGEYETLTIGAIEIGEDPGLLEDIRLEVADALDAHAAEVTAERDALKATLAEARAAWASELSETTELGHTTAIATLRRVLGGG